jgi:hypothetical protein
MIFENEALKNLFNKSNYGNHVFNDNYFYSFQKIICQITVEHFLLTVTRL